MEKYKICCAVHGIIIKNGKVLLQRRNNKEKWGYGKLGLPAGHLEVGENVYQAISREMREELNINIKNPSIIQVMNVNGGTDVYDAYFFLVDEYDGEIINNEESDTSNLEWLDLVFPIKDLLEYENFALESYINNPENKFTLFGWKE